MQINLKNKQYSVDVFKVELQKVTVAFEWSGAARKIIFDNGKYRYNEILAAVKAAINITANNPDEVNQKECDSLHEIYTRLQTLKNEGHESTSFGQKVYNLFRRYLPNWSRENDLTAIDHTLKNKFPATGQVAAKKQSPNQIHEEDNNGSIGIQQCEQKRETLTHCINSLGEKYTIACKRASTSLTYSNLNGEANQLAHFLLNLNVKVGDSIAIMGFNQVETLISLLAALKIGATFVVFEPSLTKERLELYLNKSGVSWVLTNESMDIPFNPLNVVNTVEQKQEISKQSLNNPPLCIEDESALAYLLFTSGSTSSLPKVVMQTRQGLLGQMLSHAEDIGIESTDNLLQISNIAHDQALCTIMGALLKGACLSFYDTRQLDLQKLRQYIIQERITIFTSIPSVFHAVFSGTIDSIALDSLRLIRLGGEEVTLDHIALYRNTTSARCALGIGYGSTECSWSFYLKLSKMESNAIIESKVIPLGTPSSHITPFMEMDEGKYGELCIASPYLFSGYKDNPEAQEAAFFTKEGKLYYRTGDLVENADQTYIFRGRKHWHCKINGERVSLKVIEDNLRAHLPIQDGIVIPQLRNETVNLYAFYTGSKEINEDETRRILGVHLRSIEIPKKYFRLDAFPKLPNQKVNRNELTNILVKKLESAKVAYYKDAIDRAFFHVLKDDYHNVSENLNFNELGISSLQIAQLYQAINNELSIKCFNIKISLIDIYSANSIKSLKELITTKRQQTGVSRAKINASIFLKTFQGPISTQGAHYTNDDVGVTPLSFYDLSLLSKHYNQMYNIKIMPCESMENFEAIVQRFIAGDFGSQIGVFISLNSGTNETPEDSRLNAHFTPFIFTLHEGKFLAFIGDPLGNPPYAAFPIGFLQSKAGENVYIDPYRRILGESCASEAFIWLLQGLRLKEHFFKCIKHLDPETLYKHQKYGSITKYFLSAPDQLIASQEDDNFQDLENTQLILSNETFGHNRIRYTKKAKFRVLSNMSSAYAPKEIEFEFNDYLGVKSLEFKELVRTM